MAATRTRSTHAFGISCGACALLIKYWNPALNKSALPCPKQVRAAASLPRAPAGPQKEVSRNCAECSGPHPRQSDHFGCRCGETGRPWTRHLIHGVSTDLRSGDWSGASPCDPPSAVLPGQAAGDKPRKSSSRMTFRVLCRTSPGHPCRANDPTSQIDLEFFPESAPLCGFGRAQTTQSTSCFWVWFMISLSFQEFFSTRRCTHRTSHRRLRHHPSSPSPLIPQNPKPLPKATKVGRQTPNLKRSGKGDRRAQKQWDRAVLKKN